MPPDEYVLLFEHMLDGFALHAVILDAVGKPCNYRFLAVNPAFEKQTGLAAKDVVGRTVLDILPDTDHSWVVKCCNVALTGVAFEAETYSANLDQHYRTAVFKSGREQFAVVFQNVTERVRHRELLERHVRERTAELRAANEEMASFSYAISHDLCSPLRAINGFAAMLAEMDGTCDGKKAKVFIDRIRKATMHMNSLIRGLLTLSKTTQAELKREVVDVTGIAKAVVENLYSEDTSRKATVTIQPGMTALGDPTLIRALYTNLLNNAWKFTAGKPVTEIRIGWSGAVFFVEDNGAGFDEAYMDKLFKPFQRLHSPEEYPGTGIGLATVQRVVRRHGGEVWARSPDDEGATFYFTLPRAPADL